MRTNGSTRSGSRPGGHRALALIVVLSLVPVAAASEAAVGPVVVASQKGSTSLGTTCRDGPETGRKYLNSEVEPMVALDPTDPSRLVGAYQQDRWSNGGARGVVTVISTDGGLSWTRQTRTKSSFCTGGRRRNGGDFERATDPWVTIAPNGDAYLMTLSLNGSDADHAMLIRKLDATTGAWRRPRTLVREAKPSVLNDKNSVTADPNEADGSHVYAVWDRLLTESEGQEPVFGFTGPAMFSRTTDGGQTWSEPVRIYATGSTAQTLGNQILVSPDLGNGTDEGQLLNLFSYIVSLRGRREVSILRSFDQGETWSEPIVVADELTVGVVDPDPDGEQKRDSIRAGGLIPDGTVDRATGSVYVVWQDARFNDFDYDGILFSRSDDGGATWSDPMEINKTPDSGSPLNRQAFTPAVAVAPDGTIAVTYYDFRNNDTGDHATLETDHWVVHCHPTVQAPCTNSDDWVENGPIGPSFNMKAAPYARGYFVGDYVEVAPVGNNDFLAFFSRARNSKDPATVYSSLISLP
jgi:hypothetical protein